MGLGVYHMPKNCLIGGCSERVRRADAGGRCGESKVVGQLRQVGRKLVHTTRGHIPHIDLELIFKSVKQNVV